MNANAALVKNEIAEGRRSTAWRRDRRRCGLGLLLSALAFVHQAAASCPAPTFSQAVGSPVTVGDAPHSTTSGDFNNDGKRDLAVLNAWSDELTILLGNGAGGFTGSTLPVGTFPLSVATGDFNNDGNADLATANHLDETVSILLGNGLGGFTEHADSPIVVDPRPSAVAVGDFNQDGNPDVAVANWDSGEVTILTGNGTGAFTASVLPIGGAPEHLVVGDLDKDGNLDIAVASWFSSPLTILWGDGAGGFTTSTVADGDLTSQLAIGDLNLDGNPDLVAANVGSWDITVLLGDGAGGFTPSTIPDITGSSPYSVAVGDFNQDGKPDLAASGAAGPYKPVVNTFLGDGLGGFAPSTVIPARGPYSIVVDDFNLDLLPDLAVPGFDADFVQILLNTCGLNNPPVAQCQDATVVAGVGCAADASIDNGSFDPDGDAITISQEPAGPYPIGDTLVTLTVTDSNGASSQCAATVTVIVGNKCPQLQGWWKNHAGDWPVSSLELGVQSYDQAELLAILNTPTVTDASLILARQLIAAMLNITNGSDPTPVCDAIAAANSLLGGYSGKLPYQVKTTSPAGKQMVALAKLLEDYNKGLLTPGCAP